MNLFKVFNSHGYCLFTVLQVQNIFFIFTVDINTEVDVLYVDYGNKERVKVIQLRTLPEEFKTLPMQAICCALAEVI